MQPAMARKKRAHTAPMRGNRAFMCSVGPVPELKQGFPWIVNAHGYGYHRLACQPWKAIRSSRCPASRFSRHPLARARHSPSPSVTSSSSSPRGSQKRPQEHPRHHVLEQCLTRDARERARLAEEAAFGDAERLTAMTSVTRGGTRRQRAPQATWWRCFSGATRISRSARSTASCPPCSAHRPSISVSVPSSRSSWTLRPPTEYAFNLFLRDAREGTARAALWTRRSRPRRIQGRRRLLPLGTGHPARGSWGSTIALLHSMRAPGEIRAHGFRAGAGGPRRPRAHRGLVAGSGTGRESPLHFSQRLGKRAGGSIQRSIGRGMKTCPVRKPGARSKGHGPLRGSGAGMGEHGGEGQRVHILLGPGIL